MITGICQTCQKKWKVGNATKAKRLKCPGCGAVLPVPAAPKAAGTPERQAQIEQLLTRWLDLQEAGIDMALAELCCECPELLPEIQARIDFCRKMDEVSVIETIADREPPAEHSTRGDEPEALPAAPGIKPAPPKRRELSFLHPPQQDDELGRLAHYRVLRILGQGGMGLVFLAEDLQLKRQVALKVMLPRHSANERARLRFVREAQAQAAIEHDHIVAIHHIGEDRGVPYLAMPLLRGESLADRLKRRERLPNLEIVRIGKEAAEGLEAAHQRGLIHRDIKPANIWLETREESASGSSSSPRRVRILDFGLARAGELEEDQQLTRPGAIVGTPAFMSPEQARGRKVDARSDLFSLGTVLYVMATGKLPFAGNDTMAILTALAVNQPKPPRRLNPDLPPSVEELILKLLAKKPSDRYASAAQVAQQLAAIQKALSTPPKLPAQISAAPPLREAAASRSQTPPPLPEARKSKSRTQPAAPAAPKRAGPRWWLLASAMLLLLAVGLGTLFSGILIRINTDRGTLVISSEAPDVEVCVKQGGAIIKDRTTAREIELNVGNYEIELAEVGKGLKLSTNRFSITRGKQEVVRVWLEKNSADNAADSGNWVSLFNGRDLSGWKTYPGGTGRWRVENGMMICDGNSQFHNLFSERGDFEDFVVRLEAKINERGDSGLSFRAAFEPEFPSGYEATIRVLDEDPNRTGSLFNAVREPDRAGGQPKFQLFLLDRTTNQLVQPETWFTLEVSAIGNELKVRVNGEEVSNYRDPAKTHKRGHFGIQLGDNTRIAVRKVEIKDLTSARKQDHPLVQAQTSPSPLDNLSRDQIAPEELKMAGGGDPASAPAELVAILGDGRLKHWGQNVGQLAFDPSGKVLASMRGHDLRLWDTTTGYELRRFPTSEGHIDSIAFSPDGKILAAANRSGKILLWEPATGKLSRTLVHSGEPYSVAFGSKGSILAAAGSEGAVTIWDLQSDQSQTRFEVCKHEIRSVIYHPTRNILACAGQKMISTWDLETGKQLKAWDTGEHSPVYTLSYSSDGKQLISGANEKGKIWDPETAKEIGPFDFHMVRSCGTAWLPGDKAFIASNGGTTACVKRYPGGEDARILPGVSGYCWLGSLGRSADGHLIAAGDHAGVIRVWNAATGAELFPAKTGQRSRMNTIAFSPDGKLIFTGNRDNGVALWQSADGRRLHSWCDQECNFVERIACCPKGETLAVNYNNSIKLFCSPNWAHLFSMPAGCGTASFSVDGRKLVYRRDDNTAAVYDLNSQRVITSFASKNGTPAQAIHPGGQQFAVAAGNDVIIADLSGKVVQTLTGHLAEVFWVSYSPDGKMLATASADGTARLWNARTGQLLHTLQGHTARVRCVAFRNDGKQLVSCSDDGTVRLWDVATGAEQRTIQLAPQFCEINQVAFSPDGRHLGTANGNGTAYILRLESPPLNKLSRERIAPEELKMAGGGDPANAPEELVAILGDGRLKHWGQGVGQLAFDPSGKILASMSGHDLKLWDTTTGYELRRLPVSEGHIEGIAFSPDGKILAAANRSGKILLWEPATGKLSRTLVHHGEPYSVAYSSNGSVLAAAGFEGAVTIWDLQSDKPHKPPRRFEVCKHEIRSVIFHPSRNIIACAGQKMICTWDLDTGKQIQKWDTGEYSPVWTLSYSSDGKMLISGAIPKGKMWDPEKGREVGGFDFNMVRSCGTAWLPGDKSFIASNGGTTTCVRRYPGGELVHLLPGVSGYDNLACLTRSPNGDLIAAGDGVGVIRLWSTATGEEQFPAKEGQRSTTTAVAFSPDGKVIFTGNRDNGVTLCDATDGTQGRSVHSWCDAEGSFVWGIACCPTGKTLAVAHFNSLKLFSWPNCAPLFSIPGYLDTPSFNGDGSKLVFRDGETSAVCDLKSRRDCKLRSTNGAISQAFHPGGLEFASTDGKDVSIADLSGKVIRTLTGHTATVLWVSYSADAKMLATASEDNTVRLWDAADGKMRHILTGHTLPVRCVAFRCDGKRIASCSNDGTVRLWDVATGAEQRTIRLAPQFCEINQIAFSPDGRHLATANGNGTAYILRVSPVPEGK